MRVTCGSLWSAPGWPLGVGKPGLWEMLEGSVGSVDLDATRGIVHIVLHVGPCGGRGGGERLNSLLFFHETLLPQITPQTATRLLWNAATRWNASLRLLLSYGCRNMCTSPPWDTFPYQPPSDMYRWVARWTGAHFPTAPVPSTSNHTIYSHNDGLGHCWSHPVQLFDLIKSPRW